MIRTLRTNAGSFANMGSVQLQPLPLSSIQSTLNASATAPSAANLQHPIILQDAGSATLLTNVSVDDLIVHLTSDHGLVVPLAAHLNAIVPSYDPGMQGNGAPASREGAGFIASPTKFQPYERITGIVQERPEIVMLTHMVPLFDRTNVGSIPGAAGARAPTPAGDYADAQQQLRAIRSSSALDRIGDLVARYPNVSRLLQQRQDVFRQELVRLKDDASFLLNFVRLLEAQRVQLDLRHDLYQVDPTAVSEFIAKNFNQQHLTIGPLGMPGTLEQLAQVGLRPSYDFITCLVDLGYLEESARTIFSSTKIWLQTIAEAKAMLRYHSLGMVDVDALYQRNDSNPTVILNPPVRYFDLASPPNILNLDELVNLRVADVATTTTALIAAFRATYQNAFFKDEETRVSALAHLLSREYKYSYALTRDPVIGALLSYGYDVLPGGNPALLDSIFGVHGNNISDVPALQKSRSLSSVAQFVDGSTGILTFETKYVDGDTGTLTPGGDYYFSSLLDNVGSSQLSTARIDSLVLLLEDQLSRLNVVIDGFNMLNLPAAQGYAAVSWVEPGTQFLATTNDVVRAMAARLINVPTGETLESIATDGLGAVYAQARFDDRVKSLLFMLALSRISRSYNNRVLFLAAGQQSDNTPLVDQLVELIAAAINDSVGESAASAQRSSAGSANTGSLTLDAIKQSLKQGTPLSHAVEEFISAVITQFRVNTRAIEGNFTRYNGHLDTTVLMVAFDIAVSMIAKYTDQRFVGTHAGLQAFQRNRQVLVVSNAATNHLASFNQLLQRGDAESALARQLLLTIVNALRNLSGSLRGISNYLTSDDVRARVQQIASSIAAEPATLRLLMSEQQVLLLASNVENLAAAAGEGGINGQPTRLNMAMGAGRRSSLPRLLDEGAILPAVRDAVFGYMSLDDAASNAAYNKRILTVGIPAGFTQRLKQRVSVSDQRRSAFSGGRVDVVNVVVYKVDVQNPDVVYKPVRFLFEMARFPVPYTTGRWLQLPEQPSMADVVRCVPTQRFAFGSTSRVIAGGSTVEYASPISSPSERSQQAAFSDRSYDFLSELQKAQLLTNHVTSQLMESYVRMLTGLDVSERSFALRRSARTITTTAARTLVEHVIDSVRTPTAPTAAGNRLFATSIAGGRQPPATSQFNGVQPAQDPTGGRSSGLATDVSQLTSDQLINLLEGVRSINVLSNALSTVSDPEAVRLAVMTPKIFDRVFNVVVDSRDFDVDVQRTVSTPFGKQALELLVLHGDVIPGSPTDRTPQQLAALVDVQALGRSDLDDVRLRPRDRAQGDLIADKYFVTVESFDEVST